jgi:hypothetical protein
MVCTTAIAMAVSHAWVHSRSAPHITSGVSRAIAMAYTQRIKLNLVVPARCEPKSALYASAINRHVDRALDPSPRGAIG